MTQVLIDRATLEQLVVAHQNLIRAYVNLLETGRDRILQHGGTCDPVDVMEAKDPALREAKASLTAGRAALAVAEPSVWQPIETAPKGEIIVLCLPPFKGYRTDDRRVYEGRWHEPQATWTGVNGFLLLGEATHWMPLPTPPKEQP